MYDKLEVLTAKINQTQFTDIGMVCEELKFDWELEGSAGVLNTSYIEKEGLEINEGDVIVVKLNGYTKFYGWVFSKSKSADDSTKIKAYNSKRYLAYKDVNVTGGETVDQCFERICKMMKMEYSVVDRSSYILPYKIHDGETYNDMIQYAIDQTFIATNQRFCVRCNGKKLELINCENHKKDITIGDAKLLTDYEFSSDIEDTYTSFKVQRELGSEEQKGLNEVQKIMARKDFVDQDNESINKWGFLQYYEKKDAKWTDAQINEHLKNLKVRYNKQTKSLKLSALGNINCIPGNMIKISISDLEKENIPKDTFFLIKQATHTITHKDYTMELTMEVM